MRLVPGEKDLSALFVALLITLVLGISILFAVFLSKRADTNFRSDLADRAQTIAHALDTEDIALLTGTASDQTSQTYTDIKSKLAAIKAPSANNLPI